MHIGIAGIGKMGAAIGSRLLSQGYKVTVWNRTSVKAQSLLDAGAQWAPTPKALAESVDVVLLCASHEGYRTLRNAVNENSLGPLLTQAMPLARAVRADRYGIRTFLMVDDVPIKFEIVREDRIPLQAQTHPGIPILTLSPVDMFAEKLLANTDRWADRSTTSRDIIDLAMMNLRLPQLREALKKATEAYGTSISRDLGKAIDRMQNRQDWLDRCMAVMAINIPKVVLWQKIRSLRQVIAVR